MPVPCQIGCYTLTRNTPVTPIQKVAGIGQVLAAHLAAIVISTAEQLAKTSPETLANIPRLGAQRASALLAAAQKIIADPENEASVAAPAPPVAGTEATSAVTAVPDEPPAPQVKTGKNAAPKADADKTAKEVSDKAPKVASEMKAKTEKAPKKKVAKAAKRKAENATKVKAEKPAKTKKKKQSKKK